MYKNRTTLSNYEEETIISFSEDSKVASVYTAAKRVANKIIRSGVKPIKVFKDKKRQINGWIFQIETFNIIIKPGKTAYRLGVKSRKTTQLIEEEEEEERPE